MELIVAGFHLANESDEIGNAGALAKSRPKGIVQLFTRTSIDVMYRVSSSALREKKEKYIWNR